MSITVMPPLVHVYPYLHVWNLISIGPCEPSVTEERNCCIVPRFNSLEFGYSRG